ncbi:DUF6745 domain-containing protein, partial [Acaryochloris marina NIES-2412]|uniref:DUF6745 domain-containing protein n=1 Tax=Acaryochloris marina TaxID=155978 RepID=UPI004057DA45
QICFSIQPIEQIQAKAAVKGVYAVMGQREPDVIFCTSPKSALEKIQASTSNEETSQKNVGFSQKDIRKNFLWFFLKTAYQVIQLKRKQSGTGPILELLTEVSKKPTKQLKNHIKSRLPKGLTTQDIVEQAFLGSSPLFNALGKQMAFAGDSSLLNMQPEDWQQSFSVTAANLETQLAWLPGKKFLFRSWLVKMLHGTLIAKISGIEYPQLQEAFFCSLSSEEQQIILENPLTISSDLGFHCSWLDFAISVLNYPHLSKKWAALQGVAKHCGWIFAMDNVCIVCDRPIKILLDEANQLHGEGESALQFADGFTIYAHHGTPLPEHYGSIHPNQWQAQWILDEKDANLKKVLMLTIGAVRLCQELSLFEVDTQKNYTLFKIENSGLAETYILRKTRLGSDKIYAVFIPWHANSIESAMQYASYHYSQEDFPIQNN